jgi:hemerythrin superfamily protein
MDALELLKSDHQRINSLFDQFRNAAGFQDQKQIFHSIQFELNSHGWVEETTFYPVFRNYPEFKELVTHSLEDHGRMKSLLREIPQIRDPGLFQSRVQELMETVRAHVLEEETSFFPKVRQLMKRTERETLGRHLQAARHEQTQAA